MVLALDTSSDRASCPAEFGPKRQEPRPWSTWGSICHRRALASGHIRTWAVDPCGLVACTCSGASGRGNCGSVAGVQTCRSTNCPDDRLGVSCHSAWVRFAQAKPQRLAVPFHLRLLDGPPPKQRSLKCVLATIRDSFQQSSRLDDEQKDRNNQKCANCKRDHLPRRRPVPVAGRLIEIPSFEGYARSSSK